MCRRFHPQRRDRAQPDRRLHWSRLGALAQLGERRLCKPEVTGSIPVRSTRKALQISLTRRPRVGGVAPAANVLLRKRGRIGKKGEPYRALRKKRELGRGPGVVPC